MTLFLPFQNGEKVIFTAETVAQRNGTVVAKQALRWSGISTSSAGGEAGSEKDQKHLLSREGAKKKKRQGSIRSYQEGRLQRPGVAQGLVLLVLGVVNIVGMRVGRIGQGRWEDKRIRGDRERRLNIFQYDTSRGGHNQAETTKL